MMAGGILAAIVVAGLVGFAIWSRHASSPAAPLQVTIAAPVPPAAAESTVPAIPTPMPPPVVVPAPPAKGSNTSGTTGRTRGGAPTPIATEPARSAQPARVPEVSTPPTVPVPAAAPTSVPEPKPAPPEPKPAPPEPKPPPAEPATVVAPPVAVPPPSPAPAPPARAEESVDAAVQTLLGRYRSAIEARDIGALKRIWPALSGRQEEALVNEFQHARAISVGVGTPDIRPTATGATVSCRRTYAVTTADGQTLRTVTTMVMTLGRHDGAWSIESIRHEAAR
jgi:hypothetical protein